MVASVTHERQAGRRVKRVRALPPEFAVPSHGSSLGLATRARALLRVQQLAWALALLQGAFAACDPSAPTRGRSPSAASADTRARKPVARLYFLGAIGGALEPCGCQPDMQGGLDHAAVLLGPHRAAAAYVPVLAFAAGATFFQGSELQPRKRAQDMFKAQTIARSLGELPLVAWTPGLSDFAAGAEQLAARSSRAAARRSTSSWCRAATTRRSS
jgi:hypothetical protein